MTMPAGRRSVFLSADVSRLIDDLDRLPEPIRLAPAPDPLGELRDRVARLEARHAEEVEALRLHLSLLTRVVERLHNRLALVEERL